MTEFFRRRTLQIIILRGIFDNFALRISLIDEEFGKCNTRRDRLLLFTSCLSLLLLVTLSFLLFAFVQG
jgi:hypothetical protein